MSDRDLPRSFLVRVFARVLSLLVCALSFGWPAVAAAADPGVTARQAQRLVAVLQYVASDYPAAVESGSKLELEEQRAFLEEATELAKGLGHDEWLARLSSIDRRVEAQADPVAVAKDATALAEEVVTATGIVRSPKAPPDLARGKTLFDQQCASCHGEDGAAKTPIAEKLDPQPASFREGPRIDGLTPFRVFNTTLYGVKGTAMPPFPQLSDEERWAVAFHVLSLRHAGRCTGDPPRVSLEILANGSDESLAKAHPGAVACLRTKLPALDLGAQILMAKGAVREAVRLAAAGSVAAARQSLLDAYLQGIEPIEPLLRSRDPALVQRLEEAFLAMRLSADRGERDLSATAARIDLLLDEAARTESRAEARSIFALAMLILVREGFEVTVVLGALLAILKKMRAREQAWVVHAGWVAALIVGAIVFVFARRWIAGSNREWVEGSVALASVVMLLYAAFWLNARANTRKFMGELRERMTAAIRQGGGRSRMALGLFAISFSAMLRESVETALFLQGLAIDGPVATAWGAAFGLVVLVGLVLAMSRFGLKLPMKRLFDLSTAILFATAVVLLGKGIHALQEVGAIPLRPIPMVRIDLLGIFPDAIGLAAQALLLAAPFVYKAIRRDDDAEAEARSTA
jgi:high-affinity iron transporter